MKIPDERFGSSVRLHENTCTLQVRSHAASPHSPHLSTLDMSEELVNVCTNVCGLSAHLEGDNLGFRALF